MSDDFKSDVSWGVGFGSALFLAGMTGIIWTVYLNYYIKGAPAEWMGTVAVFTSFGVGIGGGFLSGCSLSLLLRTPVLCSKCGNPKIWSEWRKAA
jgi:hypothetical protein